MTATTGDAEQEYLLHYWFTEPMNKHWFVAEVETDKEITEKFERLWVLAADNKLQHWQHSAQGCLALCIVLDQLPLNMYRGLAKCFSTEKQAVTISKHALSLQFDEQIAADKVAFLIMPLMHSENLADQDLSVSLFEKHQLDANLRFARHHRDIVKRFGRFPHRNRILGRASSADELTYLNSAQAFTG
ncbi:MAG: DUF924 domain-containing protein [Gammaproteobacteria bacterium]|nr:DUF924 domain-containing protein [Gammaproteobacteria bacterium]